MKYEDFEKQKISDVVDKMFQDWEDQQELLIKPQVVGGKLREVRIHSDDVVKLLLLNGTATILLNDFLNEFYPWAKQQLEDDTVDIPDVVKYAKDKNYKIDFGSGTRCQIYKNSKYKSN